MQTRVLAILCILLAQHEASADGTIYAVAPKDRGLFQVGGQGGQYHYGYNTGDGIAKVEVRQPDGSVVGSYRYFDPLGRQVIRSYIADKNGFRVLGNDLPISPNTPAFKINDFPGFTAPVEGTDIFSAPVVNVPTPQLKETLKTETQSQNRVDDLIQQREELLKKQQLLQNELDRLTQQSAAAEEATTTTATTSVKTVTVPIGDSIYYSYPYAIDFDFPAGFAFQSLLKVVPPPIAVVNAPPPSEDLTAGHTKEVLNFLPPLGVQAKRRFEPVNRFVAGTTQAFSHFPGSRFIVGHAKR